MPTFTLDAVRRRLAKVGSIGLDDLLSQSRDGTPLTTANVRRQFRQELAGAGITVATAVNNNASIELAAEIFGHADTRVTVMYYVQRNEFVNPATAAHLDRASAKDED
jgi:integrase